MSLFDSTSTKEIESRPSILSFLLYADELHDTLHKKISAAIGNLDVLTGEHFGIFYVDTRYEVQETYEIDPGSLPDREDLTRIGWAKPLSEISRSQNTFRATKHIEHTVALGQHFNIGEPLNLPCIVFFERFDTDEAYVFPLDGVNPDQVVTFILEAAEHAKVLWTARLKDGSRVVDPDLRREAFSAFKPFLNRKHYTRTAFKIAGYGGPIGALITAIAKKLLLS